MAKTTISWTDYTFNPWMGCSKVSEGCRNCYAEKLTTGRMGLDVWGADAQRQVTKAPWKNAEKWDRMARDSGESIRVFCASLCDVFEDHPTANENRHRVWDLIRRCDALDWQMLTKRPERIAECLPDDWGDGWPHVWLGTTIEDQRVAHRRDVLASVPAAIRFVSYEPAIGPLKLDLSGIDWVIYGGESGPGFRPEGTPEEPKLWAKAMRDDCAAAGVAYFHKQSAGWKTGMGEELEGKICHAFPRPRRSVKHPAAAGSGVAPLFHP